MPNMVMNEPVSHPKKIYAFVCTPGWFAINERGTNGFKTAQKLVICLQQRMCQDYLLTNLVSMLNINIQFFMLVGSDTVLSSESQLLKDQNSKYKFYCFGLLIF